MAACWPRRLGRTTKPAISSTPGPRFYAAGRVGKPATCRYGIKSGNGQYPLGNSIFCFFNFFQDGLAAGKAQISVKASRGVPGRRAVNGDAKSVAPLLFLCNLTLGRPFYACILI